MFEPIGRMSALNIGCGITAKNREDAITLLRERVFDLNPMPEIISCIEDVDVSTLDEGHVLPNMGSVVKRGVWFPVGY